MSLKALAGVNFARFSKEEDSFSINGNLSQEKTFKI